jgi:hemolysin III
VHPSATAGPTRERHARKPSNDLGRDWPLHQRFSRADGRDDPLGCEGRPSWRGRVHLIALCVAIPAVALLIVRASGPRGTVGASVYAAGLCAMFLASTTYHRWVHELRSRAAWRRADHAMIFAAIAASPTPIILVVMPSLLGVALLVVIWALAIAGATLKFGRWRRGDAIGSVFYAVISALAALVVPALWTLVGVGAAVLYIVSGALYIVGAHAFARTWPRLRPSVFSFHEVWHVFTVAAAAAHFCVVWQVVHR